MKWTLAEAARRTGRDRDTLQQWIEKGWLRTEEFRDGHAAAKASGDAARADHLTVEHVEAVIAAGEKVDEACENFRRRFFPRVHKVVTAGGEVFTVSKTGRSTRRVHGREAR